MLDDPDLLFDRNYRITVRNLRVDNLRCVYRVTRHLKPDPNTCELKIYGLSEDSRRSLENIPERPKNLTLAKMLEDITAHNAVRLEVGYQKRLSQIYLGEMRAAHSVTQGTDIITELTSGDAEKDIQETRIHVPVGAGTSIDTALSAIVKALGIGEGNLATILPRLKLTGAAQMYVKGTVLSGSAADELDAFCKSANLEWSVQFGKLQILDRGKALAGLAFQVSANTGLIESPSVDSKGVASFTLLSYPDMYPGRSVVFDSKHLKGPYRVEECTYRGDTYAKEWYIDCKAKRIKVA